jgi:serine/threonine protein kinase
MCNQ